MGFREKYIEAPASVLKTFLRRRNNRHATPERKHDFATDKEAETSDVSTPSMRKKGSVSESHTGFHRSVSANSLLKNE